ncbi:hypothetical protein [Micromonospora humidisoli]|uniref:Uncharacterized protein n=1 Tax=Micromonospora humidisoli TaxID=2807622 RepID=A0ABS2J3T7_9ACTN|nr:hypothetical protein [Micromonospora humidisoli]MBM7081227.1 hypothetical protein [Micromonospora humidisoli]
MSTLPAPKNYLMFLPFAVKSEATIRDIFVIADPWGGPLVAGFKGTDIRGAEKLTLVYESPLAWIRTTARIGKFEHELLHMQRFATDHKIATGEELYEAIVEGGDPPDLLAHHRGGRFGWELTAFTVSQRRQAQALFFKVASEVAQQQRHRVGHLSGFQVYMWFGAAEDVASLPFRDHDSAAHDRLIEALVAFRPDRQSSLFEGDAPPLVLDTSSIVRTVDDVSFYAMPLMGSAPASGLYAMTGMNLGLAFQSDHDISDEWARLQAHVSRKDEPGTDGLLISVGAPDRMGRCFLSEELLAGEMLQSPRPITASHLSTVILHFWSTGRAFELLGNEPFQRWPELYQGFVPSAHPFVREAQA